MLFCSTNVDALYESPKSLIPSNISPSVMAVAQKIEDDRNKVYDTNKMIDAHRAYLKSVMDKQMRQQIREKEEENLESEKKILWN